jgi:hypothetical protein
MSEMTRSDRATSASRAFSSFTSSETGRVFLMVDESFLADSRVLQATKSQCCSSKSSYWLWKCGSRRMPSSAHYLADIGHGEELGGTYQWSLQRQLSPGSQLLVWSRNPHRAVGPSGHRSCLQPLRCCVVRSVTRTCAVLLKYLSTESKKF